ncbi:hypothetical protein [Caldicellulosiruptor acetigenus]|uniref:hypothetical protein n=1 Tax=Caldicellulosiruptor acetigenus TaxID=301953 RepID=UPI001E4CA50F|nr:hypothetical protein [Caldicellulosiruptor acetigenus]
MKVNDEKLDRIFEEAFKVEYRKEFKQELKDVLLKEYDKRKKARFFLRISTVVAACIVLAIVAFGAMKLDLMRLNVPDTSFVKTEMEKAFTQQDTSTKQETKQNSKNSKDNSLSVEQKTSQNSDVPEKSQTQSTKQKQSSNDAYSTSSSAKPESKKTVEKSSSITKKSSFTTNENKNASSKKPLAVSSSLPNSSAKKIVESDVKNKTKQSIEKASESNAKNESSNTTVIVTKQNIEPAKEQKDVVVIAQEENVLDSVYVLREEELKFDEEYILDVLGSIVSSDVYEKEYFTPQSIVQAQVYDGYFSFEVVKSDTQVSISKFSGQLEQENVLESVYNKTDLILQKLGIKDYKVSVFPQQEGYRAEIAIYFDGYRIFDADGYIDYSSSADVIGGKIYLKSFSKLKSVKIIDAETAAKEFEKRYNLKNVEPSDIAIVYKKTGELFIPVYIYIYENKIYWLEK